MDQFSPLLRALGSYIWLIFFILVVFIFQKPIIRLFRKMDGRGRGGKEGPKKKD